jgi:histidine triad (HIT) family protein
MAGELSDEDTLRVQKENCIFCKIIKGDIPSRKVFEDDTLVAVLDINPATKGHLLVMPKEHYPILPVIPPEVFRRTFRVTKYLIKGLRDGMIATGTTLFIANGAVAGQQSPHFLFHLIPRDTGDGLSNFSIPEDKGADGEKLTPALQANIAAIMRQYLQREGMLQAEVHVEAPRPKPVTHPHEEMLAPESEQDAADPHTSKSAEFPLQKKTLAESIMENGELRNLIMEHPDKVKELTKSNEDFAQLFSGINIDKLSQKLKEIEPGKKQKSSAKPTKSADLDAISRMF